MKLKELPHSIFNTLKLLAISNKKIKRPKGKTIPVIVSLTTIPSRLNIVGLVIRSILKQTYVPHKIVLYLNETYKDEIPRSLASLTGDIFEIRYSPFTFSHRKLIHALEDFPNLTIITCDDDLIYPEEWLKSLYESHILHPKDIIAHRLREIRYNENGDLLPYKNWHYRDSDTENINFLLPIGCEGILYPVGSLYKQVLNKDLFLQLAPKADDLWFKAMSLLNRTRCRFPETRVKQGVPIIGSQRISLKKLNVDEDYNRIQWEAICNYFDIKLLN